MRFLALLELNPGVSLQQLAPWLIAEEFAVWKSYLNGTLREMYFQKDPLAVSLVFERDHQYDVERELDTFPLVQKGLMSARIIYLGPWLPLEKIFDANLVKEHLHESDQLG